MRVFIAGIMQGSRRDREITSQNYRQTMASIIQAHVKGAEIIDPWALHPNSVAYGDELGRQTFMELAEAAATADVLVAFVPEASMGTAIEMWQAFRASAFIVTVSPLADNWVVKFLSHRVVSTLDEFSEWVLSGEFERAVQAHLARRSR